MRSFHFLNVGNRHRAFDRLAAATFGIAGPKGMDPAVVAKLHDVFKAALDNADVRAIMKKHELVPSFAGPADYRKRLQETARLDAEVIAGLGLQRKE